MCDVIAELAAATSVEGDAKPASPVQSTKQFSVYEATSQELIERSMAPIKKEFLCPPPPSRSGKQNDAADVRAPQSGLVQEKKSKRQLKRERREVLILIHFYQSRDDKNHSHRCLYSCESRYVYELVFGN